MKYLAHTPLTHGLTGEYIAPGEPVDLSHLTPEQVQTLLDQGAIVEDKPKSKRLKGVEEADGQV